MRSTSCILLLGTILGAPAAAQARSDTRVFESHGVPIRYLDTGAGDPVLLIHGFGGRLEFWEITGVVAGLTAAGFRVIAYDGRGHGGSGKPHEPERYGAEDVDDAVRLLDHLGVERADVVGYSRGSGITGQLAARYPRRVRSVVLGGWAVNNPVATLPRADCLAAADALAGGAFPSALARALQPGGAPPPTADQQAELARLTQQFVAANDMLALAAAFRSQCEARTVSVAELRAAGVPAMVLVGAQDGMAPAATAMARELAGTLELTVIPDADHYTTPRRPEFVARLADFLTTRRQGGGRRP